MPLSPFRTFLGASAVMTSLLSVGLVQAQESFSDVQKSEINALIRAYILENPEILPEAFDELQRRQEVQMIAAAGPALLDTPGAVLIGPKDASVTIVEFYDYRCGFCRKGLADLERILRVDKDVNILFRQFPIRDREGESYSYDAALAALAAKDAAKDDEGFLAFHKALYSSPSRLTRERIYEIAQDVGLDEKKLKAGMNDKLTKDAIGLNFNLARALRLDATPSYIIGDKIILGAEGYSTLVAAIKDARARKTGR